MSTVHTSFWQNKGVVYNVNVKTKVAHKIDFDDGNGDIGYFKSPPASITCSYVNIQFLGAEYANRGAIWGDQVLRTVIRLVVLKKRLTRWQKLLSCTAGIRCHAVINDIVEVTRITRLPRTWCSTLSSFSAKAGIKETKVLQISSGCGLSGKTIILRCIRRHFSARLKVRNRAKTALCFAKLRRTGKLLVAISRAIIIVFAKI